MLLAVVAGSCIHNDIPYPWIQVNFLELTAKGQSGATTIDSTKLTATISFPEQTDISAVSIESYKLTAGATVAGNVLDKPIDLSSPFEVTLSLYQDYTWKIVGLQTIERYFDVEGQIGQSVIDEQAQTVTLTIPDTRPLDAVKVLKAKLEPLGGSMEPDLADGGTIDATKPVSINVTAWGRVQKWTVTVEQTHVNVRTLGVDAFSCVAWIHGQFEAGKPHGAQYRRSGDETWTTVPETDITTNGGNLTAALSHLSPNTSYEARVFSDGIDGETVTFTTGATPQMPNSDFEWWWQDGKVWCPWKQDGEAFWGTGNKGATTLGQSNTTPSTDTPTGIGTAASLETRFVGIGPLGKLAAGNIFAGYYVRTVGTNGVLSMGRPWTDRPVKLRGQYQYTSHEINYSSSEFRHLIGQPDTCIVWVALIDSEEAYEIRTDPKDRRLFDENGPEVIAYGKFQTSETTTEYGAFEIEIDYKSTSRVPRYLLVTASASKYGDYFTGGDGAKLLLDNLELVYDY